MALLGKVDFTGFFICEDFCFAGIPFKSEVPKQINLTKSQKLWENLESRQFIAFASGFNFGGLGDTLESQNCLSLLSKFLQGNHLN